MPVDGVAALAGLWHGSAWLTVGGAAGATIGAMIWWNLRRFNQAQRDGVYRVRREYGGETA